MMTTVILDDVIVVLPLLYDLLNHAHDQMNEMMNLVFLNTSSYLHHHDVDLLMMVNGMHYLYRDDMMIVVGVVVVVVVKQKDDDYHTSFHVHCNNDLYHDKNNDEMM